MLTLEVANVLYNLGVACGTLGYAAKAREYAQRALAIKQRHFGKEV